MPSRLTAHACCSLLYDTHTRCSTHSLMPMCLLPLHACCHTVATLAVTHACCWLTLASVSCTLAGVTHLLLMLTATRCCHKLLYVLPHTHLLLPHACLLATRFLPCYQCLLPHVGFRFVGGIDAVLSAVKSAMLATEHAFQRQRPYSADCMVLLPAVLMHHESPCSIHK